MNGRKEEQTQIAVKIIEVDGIIKFAVRLENMIDLIFFHRMEIVSQSKIAHSFQALQSIVFIADNKTTRFEHTDNVSVV